MCGCIKYKWSAIWKLVNRRCAGLSMLVRPRQSRSSPLAPCNNLLGFIRIVPFGRTALAYTWNSVAPLDYSFIYSRQNVQFTFAFLARLRFCRWKRHKTRSRYYWYAGYAITDLRHVDPRSRFITVSRYKERETILRSGRGMWSIVPTASGIYDFLVPCTPTRASTWHGKITVALFRASYHKDDSYSEVDGEKSHRSGFFEGRGNKIALRCISLRAD